jgi:integrase
MPILTPAVGARGLRVPSYRCHKPTGQAVVTFDGRDIYLGRYGTQASRSQYDRLIGEWLAGGRQFPKAEADLTVAEVASGYLRFAKGYYRTKDRRPSGSMPGVKVALRWLREVYGATPVSQFGPLAIEALQQRMIRSGHSRRYINDNIGRIRRVFRWAVGKEMAPPAMLTALWAVPGLRMGRTPARETQPVLPVAEDVVEATLPFLPTAIADMVRVQRLLGCRPGEVCIMRPCDIDRAGDIWSYRPEFHKTEYHGRDRVIFIGPKAQEILLPYLLRDANQYCFCPIDSERQRKAAMRSNRKTPVQPSQVNRRKRHPKRKPGPGYDKDAYRRAVARAVERANENRAENQEEPLPAWHPNQLRHSAATEIRRQFGLEAAQVILGHAKADVTQVYAERDMERAKEVVRKIG